MPVKHFYIYVRVHDTSVYLYQTERHIFTCLSDCMTSKNTALFIVTVMEVHFGKTVQSGA
jgi:hypothetical protein